MSPEAVAALTSLIGVLLGGSLSFGAQRLSHRWSYQAQLDLRAEERREKRRQEQLSSVERFITATQEAERVAYNRWSDGMTGDQMKQATDKAVETLWVTQKIVRVLCSEELSEAALTFAYRLHEAVRKGAGGESIWAFINPDREAFLDRCRNEFADV